MKKIFFLKFLIFLNLFFWSKFNIKDKDKGKDKDKDTLFQINITHS